MHKEGPWIFYAPVSSRVLDDERWGGIMDQTIAVDSHRITRNAAYIGYGKSFPRRCRCTAERSRSIEGNISCHIACRLGLDQCSSIWTAYKLNIDWSLVSYLKSLFDSVTLLIDDLRIQIAGQCWVLASLVFWYLCPEVGKRDRIPERSMKLDLPLDGQSPFSGGGRPSRYSGAFQGDDLKE